MVRLASAQLPLARFLNPRARFGAAQPVKGKRSIKELPSILAKYNEVTHEEGPLLRNSLLEVWDPSVQEISGGRAFCKLSGTRVTAAASFMLASDSLKQPL